MSTAAGAPTDDGLACRCDIDAVNDRNQVFGNYYMSCPCHLLLAVGIRHLFGKGKVNNENSSVEIQDCGSGEEISREVIREVLGRCERRIDSSVGNSDR